MPVEELIVTNLPLLNDIYTLFLACINPIGLISSLSLKFFNTSVILIILPVGSSIIKRYPSFDTVKIKFSIIVGLKLEFID